MHPEHYVLNRVTVHSTTEDAAHHERARAVADAVLLCTQQLVEAENIGHGRRKAGHGLRLREALVAALGAVRSPPLHTRALLICEQHRLEPVSLTLKWPLDSQTTAGSLRSHARSLRSQWVQERSAESVCSRTPPRKESAGQHVTTARSAGSSPSTVTVSSQSVQESPPGLCLLGP